MGWRGTVRTLGAMARASERNARRRQRELERRQKYLGKMAELEHAAHVVETYDNLLERLTSIHKECSSSINWHEVADAPAPQKPIYANLQEQKAKMSWENYKPNFFDKIFKKTEKKKAKLFKGISEAKTKDEKDYAIKVKEFENACVEWEKEAELAKKILAMDTKAYSEVIEEVNPFTEIIDFGSRITFHYFDDGLIKATLNISGEKHIPKESQGLLKSGKLSTKVMPKGQFYELYQSYVCSCILRIANELFAILPIETTIVTVKDKLLNTTNGYLEDQIIVSALIPRKTIKTLNMQSLDPCDAMKNFIHKMNFKKTTGFGNVEEVSLRPNADSI